MSAVRGEFSSRFGFIMAAAGSAVGLGNIWGFPTQVASNGGAAFVLVYLVLAFLLAYPALMAELLIGRFAKANAVTALRKVASGRFSKNLGTATGFYGIVVASLILSFYGIVAGWMLAYWMEPLASLLGLRDGLVHSLGAQLFFTLLFMLGTILIITGGVKDGIEKWSSRLMPLMIMILFLLIIYVFTQPGAMSGLKAYLIPDFSRIGDRELIISALGQAFFSLSLGVGTMLIYGSYISKQENLPVLGGLVTMIDIGIAVMAGLLIIPAMHVALENGVEIFDASGALLAEDALVFTVLPALFDSMGFVGTLVGFAFFALMSIAALTSSISMLEVPVAYTVENHGITRSAATWWIGGVISMISLLVILNFERFFGFIVTFTTQFSQPLLGLMLCVFVGWIWHRDGILDEIKQGNPDVELGLFWKIWPVYVKFICPLIIVMTFGNTLFG